MTDPGTETRQIIDRLALSPHPEGGWYRETWRANAAPGERATATAILFLLEAGQRSHWHRVDAAELWLWHAGHPLRLLTAPNDTGPVARTRGTSAMAWAIVSLSSSSKPGSFIAPASSLRAQA
jgi:predicted cupin superfamily sugar epimerase